MQFHNVTGKVYLNAEASHYLSDFTKPKSTGKVTAKDIMRGEYKSTINGGAVKFSTEPVKSQIVVEVVRNVDVEPKFKSLYIGQSEQTYKLRILHGSGAFSVTVNNTRLVDLV